ATQRSSEPTAVASGDLSRKITVDVKGEILELKNTINTMVDQLNAFAGEVTRVAREVGTEGKLGGQAEVPDVEIPHSVIQRNCGCDQLSLKVDDDSLAFARQALSAPLNRDNHL